MLRSERLNEAAFMRDDYLADRLIDAGDFVAAHAIALEAAQIARFIEPQNMFAIRVAHNDLIWRDRRQRAHKG